jgi:small-conductance mechanosensitive channel|tara:strand:- start:670 stop:999 length:330 start_codon:yes stop_codon:yes gene_type:complete
MNQEAIEKLFTELIGTYGWLFVAGFCALLFKNLITNIFAGVMFLFGTDFDVDDIVYIGGEKKARIIRQTLTKTVFHILETDRKLVVPNTDLYKLKVEKVLPGSKNGTEL